MTAGRLAALALVCALAGCEEETGETVGATAETLPAHPLTGRPECDVLIANYGACLMARPARMDRNSALFQAEIVSLSEQSKDPVLSEGVLARCKAIFKPRLTFDCK